MGFHIVYKIFIDFNKLYDPVRREILYKFS
jgi:hypothetical protein